MRTLEYMDTPKLGEVFTNQGMTLKAMPETDNCGGCYFRGKDGCGGAPKCRDVIFVPAEQAKPRVLVVVRGGVADYVADEGIDVEVFDFDNYEDDPEYTNKAPAHFKDLAEPLGVPFEGEE